MGNAPVAVFAYKRLKHLQNMMDALEKNDLAAQSELFIFSDGNKDGTDLAMVRDVRSWIAHYKQNSRFQKVSIIEQKRNIGLANSIIEGTSLVLQKYDDVIVLEDDLCVSEVFLQFMNGALEYYRGNENVWAVSGYTPPLKNLAGCCQDVYFSYRPYSWGWATWKDRWVKVDWDVKAYGRERFDPRIQRRFMRGGNLMPSMLRAQMKGRIDSWYVRWAYEASKRDLVTVYPTKSLVMNMGLDGSGTHCDAEMQDRYDVSIENIRDSFRFVPPAIDMDIAEEFKAFHSLSLKQRVLLKIKMNR